MLPLREQARQLRMMFAVPAHALGEVRRQLAQPLPSGLCQRDRWEDGEQPDERAELQRHPLAVRSPEEVVVEAVLLVPEAAALAAESIHRRGDGQVVLEELDGHVFVGRIAQGQFHRRPRHVEAVARHPGGPVCLLQGHARRQAHAAVDDTDVVESKEAALEQVVPLFVFTVHPPGEVEQELVEDPGQEVAVAFAGASLLFLIDRPGRQDVHGGIDVAEGPLVGWDLAVRVHVPLPQHEQELLLGEAGVDQAEGDAMEGQVPGRVPGVLPFVRHRDDVAAVVVPPLAIAPVLA